MHVEILSNELSAGSLTESSRGLLGAVGGVAPSVTERLMECLRCVPSLSIDEILSFDSGISHFATVKEVRI